MQLRKQSFYLPMVLSSLIAALSSLTGRAQSQTDVTAWPKVELHLHLDCSLSYQVVHQLDARITPEQYRQQFIAPPVCTNLADYITRADRAVDLMQTQKALRLVTLDMFDQL